MKTKNTKDVCEKESKSVGMNHVIYMEPRAYTLVDPKRKDDSGI